MKFTEEKTVQQPAKDKQAKSFGDAYLEGRANAGIATIILIPLMVVFTLICEVFKVEGGLRFILFMFTVIAAILLGKSIMGKMKKSKKE